MALVKVLLLTVTVANEEAGLQSRPGHRSNLSYVNATRTMHLTVQSIRII